MSAQQGEGTVENREEKAAEKRRVKKRKDVQKSQPSRVNYKREAKQVASADFTTKQ